MTNLQIEKLLKSKNLLVTKNRVAIINCLVDGHHFHAISDILDHVKGLNTKSVYNNIKTLIDCGIVDSYSFGGVSKYALNDNLNSHKAIHLVDLHDHVHHLEVNPMIFKKITKEVEDSGRKVKSIKIYVDVE